MNVDRDMYLYEPPYEEVDEEQLKKDETIKQMKISLSRIKEIAQREEYSEILEEIEELEYEIEEEI